MACINLLSDLKCLYKKNKMSLYIINTIKTGL